MSSVPSLSTPKNRPTRNRFSTYRGRVKQTKQKWTPDEVPLPRLPNRLQCFPDSPEIQVHQHVKLPGDLARGTLGDTLGACFVTALWLGATLWLCIMLTAIGARPDRSPIAATPPRATFDPSRFILNALLVPALDADALPLRWADPRPASHCGPDTTVYVNHEPLLAGALVPDAPFEIEWQTDGCRPFGAHGPRFEGRVRLTVFREDWGFSALVQPSGLRVTSVENETTLIQGGAASLPQFVEDDDLVELRPIGSDRSFP